MGFTNRKRWLVVLLLAAFGVIILMMTTVVPAITSPHSQVAQATIPSPIQITASDISGCTVHYDALSADQLANNPDKEVPGAMGPAVTQRDEAGIKAELQERRTCGANGTFDPELTATHYADWSHFGFTKYNVPFTDIDAFRAKLIANRTFYDQVETELTNLENASAFSTMAVPAGVWSVYEVPDGKGGLTTEIGTTSHAGTAVVFTYKGKQIMYRLQCGFQILLLTPPPGVPVCDQTGCTPPHPPTCNWPLSWQSGHWECLSPKTGNNVTPPAGTTTHPTGSDPLTGTPTQGQGSSGSMDLSGNTGDKGSTTPIATGATPAPTPTSSPAPTVPQAPPTTAPGGHVNG